LRGITVKALKALPEEMNVPVTVKHPSPLSIPLVPFSIQELDVTSCFLQL